MRMRFRLMFFTIVGAFACLFFGVEEYRLSARSSQEPEEISLRDLIERGENGNPNIILKDFTIFEDYIYQKKLLSGKWPKVWIPIIPTGGDDQGAGKPAAIKAFLFGEDIAGDQEVRRRFARPKLRGMVNPDAPKPGIIGSVLISRSYPGTQPGRCLIIEEGKEPAGALKLGLFGGGFVLLAGLTCVIWYLGRQLDRADRQAKANGQSPDRNQAGADDTVLEVLPVEAHRDKKPKAAPDAIPDVLPIEEP